MEPLTLKQLQAQNEMPIYIRSLVDYKPSGQGTVRRKEDGSILYVSVCCALFFANEYERTWVAYSAKAV